MSTVIKKPPYRVVTLKILVPNLPGFISAMVAAAVHAMPGVIDVLVLDSKQKDKAEF